jgi:hypothetical protein
LGVELGGFFLKSDTATWAPGPIVGLRAQKALPSGASLGFLTRFSATRLEHADALWSEGDLNDSTLDTLALHNQWLISLRFGPQFQTADPRIQLGALVEGAVGVDIVRSLSDLAGTDGLRRVRTTEPLPIVQFGVGVHALFRNAFALNATLDGQILLTFDRGERGGGDDLRVLFGLLPGVGFVGHF